MNRERFGHPQSAGITQLVNPERGNSCELDVYKGLLPIGLMKPASVLGIEDVLEAVGLDENLRAIVLDHPGIVSLSDLRYHARRSQAQPIHGLAATSEDNRIGLAFRGKIGIPIFPLSISLRRKP
ncbi:MAG TPA: hypothetical protein V6C82_03385 [Chroococcales cyanobacterium]|jgi:hypothetical protein